MRYNHFDMLPEKAFIKVGGQIKPQGGGSSTPTSTTVNNVSIPSYAQPFVEDTLGKTQALTSSAQYQPYASSDLFAQFTPLQGQAFNNISNMQVTPQIQQGTNFANLAANQAQAYANQGAQSAVQNANLANSYAGAGAQGAFANADLINAYGAQGQASGLQGQQLGIEGGGKYGSMGAGYGTQGANIGTAGGAYYGGQGMGYGAQGAGLAGANLGAGALGARQGLSYGQNAQNPYAVQSYMNPYLQASLAPAQQLLNQQYDMQGAAEQSAATSKGAFGGSREALMQGLNQQNRMLAQNQLVGNAYNQAYNTANQNMQTAAQLGMQGAGVGLQGLQGANTAYGTGIAGANTGLQGVNTQLAGTAQGMQGAQVGLAGVDRQLAGTAQGMQGAQIGLQGANQAGQLDIAGGQLGLQGAQTAGNLGIAGGQLGVQGANTQLQAAGTLGQLGQTNYNQMAGINQAQLAAGAQQQQQQQNVNNFNYQQYLNELNFPYQQLSYMQGMYSGLPMSQTSTQMYQAQPSAIPQLAGGAGAALTANAMKGGKKGGLGSKIAGYAGGGIVALTEGGQGSDAMAMLPNNATGAPSGSAIAQLNPLTLPSALAQVPDSQLQVYVKTVPPGTVAAGLVNDEVQRRAGVQQSVANIPAINAAQKTAAAMSPNELPQETGLAGYRGLQGKPGIAAYGKQPTNFQVPAGAQGGIVAFNTGGAGDSKSDGDESDAEARPTAPAPFRFSSLIPTMPSFPTVFPTSKPATAVSEQDLGYIPAATPTPIATTPPATSIPPTPNYTNDIAASMATPGESGASGTAPTLSPAANVANAKAAPITGATTAQGNNISFGKPTATPAGLGSFDQFKARIAAEAQMSPEDKAALATMQQRAEAKSERADKMQNNVMNQSLLQGFLAMMGGRTLAEGVALAANKFGSTYTTADQAAQAAKEKAEDAKDAHAQYEMALKRGDKKLAADMLEKYEKIAADRDKAALEHAAKMAQVGATNAGTLATKQYTALTSANNALTTAVAKRDAEKTAVEKSMQKSYDAQYIMVPDKDKPTFTENFNKALRRRLLEIDKAHAPYIDPLEDDAAYIRGIVQNKDTAASTNNIKPLGPKS